jgi:hypothetical protein
MKQVVIVGADFSPSSLPPALRIRFFAQHLHEFGWHPIVVSTDPKYYDCEFDPENERLLPDTVEVIRTRALRSRLTRLAGVGDVGLRSLLHHWYVVSRLCRTRKIDLLFIPVPPYFSMTLSRLVHHRFKIPSVIDYIDPWVNDYYWQLPKAERPPKYAVAYALSRVLEGFSLKHVRHITGVSEGTTMKVVGKRSWLSVDDATEIPYGGEPDDFEYLRRHHRSQKVFDPADGYIHLSCAGAYASPMKPVVTAFLSAIRSGLDNKPEIFRRLRVHFVGTSYAPNGRSVYNIMPLAREAGVEHVVEEIPNRVAYLEALQILLDSHGLFLLGSIEPHYTASKVFPYILARKPLLAIFHEGSSVVKVLNETQAAELVTFDDHSLGPATVKETTAKLEIIMRLPSDYRPPTKWSAFEPYTTRSMSARLSQAFDKALLKR